MCFLRQCCTHCLCPSLWSQCSKTGSVLAMQKSWFVVNQKSCVGQCCTHWCPTLLHTKLGAHHVCGFAAMLHSQFVPHIVATVPQSWLGLGHAVLVEKSWLDCGKSLLHTPCVFCGNSQFVLGPHHVFWDLRQCCTHCLCPSLWSQCSKTGSVLAMQPFVQKS